MTTLLWILWFFLLLRESIFRTCGDCGRNKAPVQNRVIPSLHICPHQHMGSHPPCHNNLALSHTLTNVIRKLFLSHSLTQVISHAQFLLHPFSYILRLSHTLPVSQTHSLCVPPSCPHAKSANRSLFVVCSNDTLSVGFSVFECRHEASIDPPRPFLRSSLGKNGWMAQHGHMDGWLDRSWMQCTFILSTCNHPWNGWEPTPHVPHPVHPNHQKKKKKRKMASFAFVSLLFFSFRVDLPGDVFHRPLRLEFTSMLTSVGASAATPFRRRLRRLRRALVPIRRFHAPHTCKTSRSDPKEGVGRRGGTHPWRSRTRETHGGRDVLPPTPRKKRTWS